MVEKICVMWQVSTRELGLPDGFTNKTDSNDWRITTHFKNKILIEGQLLTYRAAVMLMFEERQPKYIN